MSVDTAAPAQPDARPSGRSDRIGVERRRQRRVTVAVWVTRLLLLALLLLGWAWLTRSLHWSLLIGTPREVWDQARTWVGDGAFWSDLGWTLLEAALGYVLGVLGAVLLVAVIVPLPILARFVAPFIAMANALPKVVLAPVFILWLGFSLSSKVLFVASGIFFVIFYGVFAGVRSINRVLVDNQLVLGSSRIKLVGNVYLPSIFAWLISSLRLSAAWALTAAVISEYLGSNRGIGYLIAQGQQLLNPNTVLAGILVVAIVAVAFDRLLVLVERRFSQWRVF
jgi:NitT/TauT family transport system permease protein